MKIIRIYEPNDEACRAAVCVLLGLPVPRPSSPVVAVPKVPAASQSTSADTTADEGRQKGDASLSTD